MAREVPMEKPRVLRSGDMVGLVAPSSPFERDSVKAGIEVLKSLGFQIQHFPDLFTRGEGFLAGGDSRRAEELKLMFQDPEVKAILVVRGGYGAQRVLERLDEETLKNNPKMLLGYSDATCLLSFLLDRCNLICFHGPLVSEMGSMSLLTKKYLTHILTDPAPLGEIPMPNAKWVTNGKARAPLVGGNLSVICSTLGTPWEMRTEGRILFLEDWGEKPYRIDRMLVQLKQAGKFSSIAGLLFGHMLADKDKGSSGRLHQAMDDVLSRNSQDLGVPVVCGLPVGHGVDNLPLPLGAVAEIDSQENRFRILEGASSSCP